MSEALKEFNYLKIESSFFLKRGEVIRKKKEGEGTAK